MKNKLTDQEIEWVSDYVMDLLSEEERADFELAMLKNPLLQSEVELQHQVMVLVEEVEDVRPIEVLETEQNLKRHRPHNIKTHPKKKTRFYIWWILLEAIGLLILIYFIWQSQQNKPSEKIYAAYFETYENVVVSTIRNSEVAPDVLEAFQKYDAGNYSGALESFEKLPDNNETIDYQLYEAISLMKVSTGNSAIPLLENMLESPSSQFQEHAQWYLTLVYLKENKLEQAQLSLNNLLKKQPIIFKEKAEQLLMELEKMGDR